MHKQVFLTNTFVHMILHARNIVALKMMATFLQDISSYKNKLIFQ
jgi:hypothetical protein